MKKILQLTALTLGLASNYPAYSSTVGEDASYSQQSDQARALLEKAVSHYRESGEAALAQISRQGEFTRDEQYVYVIDTRGVMLASGGLSAIYIGRDIRPILDDDRKPAFDHALLQPSDGQMHSEEYRWLNPKDGEIERKKIWYQRVDDKIFAVGYYLPRSSPHAAQVLLDEAITAMDHAPATTLERINRLDKAFNRDDLYVFVVDTDTLKMVAHGYNPRLVGTDFRRLQAVDGQPIGQQMLKAIDGKKEAQISYAWRNPVTGKPEPKNTLIRRSGRFLVAVGYYAQPQNAVH
ncbi:cache domain-containing protein [Pseudomonas sp. GD03860]|uniref:cache domain-containing protein n=1 Tax=Pseudomonas TaxID=286 RepID=UPI0023636B6F|nr:MULTISPECIES: cache domain-containing protein [Pseudomonas]MDD2058429.1 cache domain-containing protein [Pseudomonas putida]MDH0640241.1 cache domain-containing protein [Pseudomonas sp. GD03860]